MLHLFPFQKLHTTYFWPRPSLLFPFFSVVVPFTFLYHPVSIASKEFQNIYMNRQCNQSTLLVKEPSKWGEQHGSEGTLKMRGISWFRLDEVVHAWCMTINIFWIGSLKAQSLEKFMFCSYFGEILCNFLFCASTNSWVVIFYFI